MTPPSAPLLRALMLTTLQVYDDRELRSAPMNMAIDEALLETASAPSLRFYGWRFPALSFGYFGRYADVAREGSRVELVRRWTGGGSVPHGADFTYSVILPQNVASQFAGSRAVYAEIHDAIRGALAGVLDVALARQAAPKVSDACFANAVEADVMLDGRKIAGAAQRRTRAGLLHQGSIQYAGLPARFREAFAAALCASWTAESLVKEVIDRATRIASEKYATEAWLRRR